MTQNLVANLIFDDISAKKPCKNNFLTELVKLKGLARRTCSSINLGNYIAIIVSVNFAKVHYYTSNQLGHEVGTHCKVSECWSFKF